MFIEREEQLFMDVCMGDGPRRLRRGGSLFGTRTNNVMGLLMVV